MAFPRIVQWKTLAVVMVAALYKKTFPFRLDKLHRIREPYDYHGFWTSRLPANQGLV